MNTQLIAWRTSLNLRLPWKISSLALIKNITENKRQKQKDKESYNIKEIRVGGGRYQNS